MNDLANLLRRLTAALDQAKIPFMIAGSFASTAHGAPRTTQDLDVVIDPADARALDALLNQFPAAAYYVDTETAHDALRRRSMFNVIDLATGWKVDFILRKNREFSRNEMKRRIAMPMLGISVFVASPEDTIVAKLEWSREGGGSERQRRDVAGILAAIGDGLDVTYIERWVAELDLDEEWQAARAVRVL
jgi:hypothetical protein